MFKQFSQFVVWIGLGERKVIYCQNTLTVYYCIFFPLAQVAKQCKSTALHSFFLIICHNKALLVRPLLFSRTHQKIKWYFFQHKGSFSLFPRKQQVASAFKNEPGNVSWKYSTEMRSCAQATDIYFCSQDWKLLVDGTVSD